MTTIKYNTNTNLLAARLFRRGHRRSAGFPFLWMERQLSPMCCRLHLAVRRQADTNTRRVEEAGGRRKCRRAVVDRVGSALCEWIHTHWILSAEWVFDRTKIMI